MRGLLVSASILGIAAAACATFTAEGTPDAGAADAASSEAASSDASTEASTTIDANTPPPPCDEGQFCDDFQRATSDVQGAWGDLDEALGGAAAIDTSRGAYGTSSSLRLHADTQDGSRAVLLRPLAVPAKIAVSFALRVDAFPQTRELHVVALTDESAVTTHYLYFAVSKNGLELVEQVGADSYVRAPCSGFTTNAWVPMELTLVYGTPTNVVARAGGQPCKSGQLTVPVTSIPYIQFGETYATPGDPIDVWLDEVHLTPK